MFKFSFEKLDVYEHAMKLIASVYSLIKRFPDEERFGLCNQLRRAIVSVPSNIAESCGRISYKEKTHFLEIAYGSLLESYCQLQIAVQLQYITEDELQSIRQQFFNVSNLLIALNKSYHKIIKENKI